MLEKALPSKRKSFYQLGQLLHLSIDDLARLFTILGEDFTSTMRLFGSRQADFSIQLLSGSLNDYRRATVDWWRNIEDNFPEITERPIYFVSSNTHSLTNLLSGYALGKKDILLSHIRENEPALEAEWEEINRQDSLSNLENFYYYAMKTYLGSHKNDQLVEEQLKFERERGIFRVPSKHSFDIEANIIDLSRLDPETIDRRLAPANGDNTLNFLKNSNAVILNIDYPLGVAAYNLLSKISENVNEILGIYVMGKAASLNAVKGDVIIPEVVYDEHS